MNFLSPAFAALIYVGGQVGAEGFVTGRVFGGAVLVAAVAYIACVGVDWTVAKIRLRIHGREDATQ